MGTRALAVLLLAPSVALAQFGTVTPAEIPRADVVTASGTTYGCTDTSQSVTITFTINATGGDRYDVFAQSGTCSTTQTPSTTPLPTSTVTVGTTLRTVRVSPDALRQAIGFSSCDNASDVTYYVCVYLISGSAIAATAFSDGSSKFQLAIPPAPVITDIRPSNGALDVYVAKGTLTSAAQASSNITFQATASAAGQATVTSGRENGPKIRLEGLANNIPYTVTAYAFSSAGNPSATPATSTGTPLEFKSFWSLYQDANGQEQGGCGGGAGALSLLALLPLALRRRRP